MSLCCATGFLDGQYGLVASLLSMVALTLAVLVARGLVRPQGLPHQDMRMVSLALVAAVSFGVVSGFRALAGTDLDEASVLASFFRVTLIAHRVFVVGALGLIAWRAVHSEGEEPHA